MSAALEPALVTQTASAITQCSEITGCVSEAAAHITTVESLLLPLAVCVVTQSGLFTSYGSPRWLGDELTHVLSDLFIVITVVPLPPTRVFVLHNFSVFSAKRLCAGS